MSHINTNCVASSLDLEVLATASPKQLFTQEVENTP
jgi:hypothetical protein